MKKKDITRPNIFEYNNFRKFLHDFYEYKHAQNRYFTKAFICRELGLPNTRSYFNDVINGKQVSAQKLVMFIKMMKLSKEESNYFRALVNYNQCSDPDEKELFLDQLIALNRTPKEIMAAKNYTYYREWYHSVIRALLGIIDFKDDYHHLAHLVFPPITPTQAKESIRLLEQLEMIKQDEQGCYRPISKVISTGSYIKNEIIKSYQVKSLEVARSSITRNKDQKQRVLTKVLSLSDAAYAAIEKRLERFNAEVTSIVHKDEQKADRVYQMLLLFYPQSQRGG